jgi:hypothetical protein
VLVIDLLVPPAAARASLAEISGCGRIAVGRVYGR